MLVLASISDQLDHLLFDFKACVHYFLANFYFSPKDSPSKAMKNVFYFIKKALCSEDIYFPFFFYLSAIALAWSKINLKVYDVISCLNKYILNSTFCLISWGGKNYDVETLSIDRVLHKEHFYGKIMQKICTKG